MIQPASGQNVSDSIGNPFKLPGGKADIIILAKQKLCLFQSL